MFVLLIRSVCLVDRSIYVRRSGSLVGQSVGVTGQVNLDHMRFAWFVCQLGLLCLVGSVGQCVDF